MLIALLMTVLMGFAAMGFDLAYVRLARLEMMNATDAAAHAAGVTLSISNDSSAAQAMAVSVAASNTVLGSPVSLQPSDIVFGTYDFGTKLFVAGGSPPTAVQVTGSKTSSGDGLVQLTFGRALGMAEANTTQAATAAYVNRYFQIELQASDDWICDIDNAADAAVSLLDFLNGPSGSQGDWIGLDEFTGRTQEITPLMNVRTNYALNIYPKWKRDATVLGIQSQFWSGSSPPPPPQTKGITVCNKANATPNGFGTPNVLPAAAGGYRQCPGANPPLVAVYPAAQQYAFPNHSYFNLYCSDGGPSGLFAGTDLAAAIRDGTAKLTARAKSYEPKALILINDGTPMACTGIGGGGLCGHTYGSDGATPPSGSTSSSFWDPCCANGLTCGSTQPVYKGTRYGGGAWSDGSPGNSPNGTTACDAAHQLVKDAIDAADAAAAAGIDVYVIGFFVSRTTGLVDPSGVSATFDASLIRNNGTASIVGDSSQIGPLLRKIPLHQPVSLVR